MDRQKTISSFQKELQQTPWDIKAESQLALALKNGLSPGDFLICCDRVFKREYSKDLFAAELKEDAQKKELLELHLSRTGLYDQLPEGLFYQTRKGKSRQINVNDAATDYKANKKKEEEIRRFFLPFDQGFFSQRLQLEQEESLLLEGLRTGILNDYFISFWGLPQSIPKMFLLPLVLLLPHAHKVAGNTGLMAECLAFLLKEQVVMVKKDAKISSVQYAEPAGLGESFLGINMICGNTFYEDYPVIEIKIGPLKNSRMKEYIGGGKRAEVIDTFSRFFIPAGLDIIVSVELARETITIKGLKEDAYVEGDMILEQGAEPILGYSTVLG